MTGDEGDKIMMKSAHEKANRRKREITSERGSPVFKKKKKKGPQRPQEALGQRSAGGGRWLGPSHGHSQLRGQQKRQDTGTPHSPHRE